MNSKENKNLRAKVLNNRMVNNVLNSLLQRYRNYARVLLVNQQQN